MALRRTRLLLAAAASLASLSVTASASAQATPSAPSVARDGRPWIATRVGMVRASASPSELEARARAVLPGSAASIVRTGVDRFGDGDVVVRFGQTHRGLPVIGRGVTVRFARASERAITTTDLEETLPESVTPSVPAATAAKASARFTSLAATEKDAHLVVWAARGGARLAWVVLPETHGLPTAPRIVVDAIDGSILEARDLVRFAKAQVYRSNPIKSPATELLELAVTPAEATGERTTLTSKVLQAVNCIDRKTVKPVDFFGFKQNMRVCDLEQTASANEAGDFVTTPTDLPGSVDATSDAFSEVSIYFHAAKAYAYFRGLQGDPEAIIADDQPLRLVANLQLPPGVGSGSFSSAGDTTKPLEPFSNAFFSPAAGGLGDIFAQLYGYKGGALWFGQGPQRDYAYDGDVVYHELGHAVVDHTLKLGAWTTDAYGVIDAPGAMNEGLADYFSSAITGDPDVGEYASKDLAPDQSVIRTLANGDTCPTALVGEVHYDSTVFSGGLWEARAALASESDRTKLDAALFKAMRTNPGRGDLGFQDATRLFLATLATDFPAGRDALEKAMTARGVLVAAASGDAPCTARVLSFDGKPIRSAQPRLGFAAPAGASIGMAGIAPGILQVKAKLPAYTTQVTFTFTAKSSEGGGGFGGASEPFGPIVLAKFGAPIRWAASGRGLADDASAKKNLTQSSGTLSATFEVPASDAETAVYFQIANQGDSDGSYDAIEITSVGDAPPEAPPADENAPTLTLTNDGGCATVPGTPPGGLAAAAAMTALAVIRRRRLRR